MARRRCRVGAGLVPLPCDDAVRADDGTVPAAGGVRYVLDPWNIDDGTLKPVGFRYQIPAQPFSESLGAAPPLPVLGPTALRSRLACPRERVYSCRRSAAPSYSREVQQQGRTTAALHCRQQPSELRHERRTPSAADSSGRRGRRHGPFIRARPELIRKRSVVQVHAAHPGHIPDARPGAGQETGPNHQDSRETQAAVKILGTKRR
jgi:hypothetical protein